MSLLPYNKYRLDRLWKFFIYPRGRFEIPEYQVSALRTNLLNLFLFFPLLLIILLFVQQRLLFAENTWPHISIENIKEPGLRKDCHKCHIHIEDQEEEIFESLLVEYEARCLACHTKIPKICELATTPNVYKILLIQIQEFPLPLLGERVTCGSCHIIHKKPGEFSLRKEYGTLKEIAEKRIDPHKTGIFCFLCHKQLPEDRQLYLKYKEDSVRLCKECHDNKRARADNHPVNIVPSKDRGITVPDEFPLKEGKIACITCHRLKCQGEKTNPYYLRGGPYKTRIDTCLTCHLREQYKKENPHDLVFADGQIREERCMFCHSLETDEKGQRVFGFKFKAPFRLYCIGCHPVKVQKHPFGAHHTGRYVESIWAGMSISERYRLAYEQSFKISPVSLSGQIMCTTCHNPHDPRPGPKLRINDINRSCRQCHYNHYGKSPARPQSDFRFIYQPVQEDFSPRGEDRYPFGYKAAIRFYCIGCHPNKDKAHPYGVNHMGRFITGFWRNIPYEKRIRLSQAENSKTLPLTTNGQIACFSCHDPHDNRKGPKLRLEEKDLLCSLCHSDRSMIIEAYKKTQEKAGEVEQDL